MLVSIIVPVYILNEELLSLTEATFESLQQTEWDGEQVELILVDDGSSVGQNFLKVHSDIYIRGSVNHGYPWAVNKGIKVSSGELLLISNNDVRVSSNWLKVAKEIFAQDHKVGSVHFRMIEYDQPIELGNDTWITGKERWCHGSFYVIRREALPEGLYDENYGLGGYDDYDLQYRLRKAGWVTAYTNKAVFQHKDSSTQLLRDSTERRQSDIKNREYFKQKFGEYPDLLFEKTFIDQMAVPWKPFP